MFEKEVLEIAKDTYIHHFDDDVKYPDVLNAIIIGTQRGAEFGFQKGIKAKVNTTTISDCPIKKQWHKVTNWEDNSQFPDDESETYLVCLYQNHYVVCGVSVTEGYREFWLEDNLENIDPQDVVAWKEIVPPKE